MKKGRKVGAGVSDKAGDSETLETLANGAAAAVAEVDEDDQVDCKQED